MLDFTVPLLCMPHAGHPSGQIQPPDQHNKEPNKLPGASTTKAMKEDMPDSIRVCIDCTIGTESVTIDSHSIFV